MAPNPTLARLLGCTLWQRLKIDGQLEQSAAEEKKGGTIVANSQPTNAGDPLFADEEASPR